MRRVLILSAAMLAGASGAAWAACTPETRVTTGLQALFQNNRVMTAQDHEHHGASGVLTECARGTSSTVEPSHVVGSWGVGADQSGGQNIQYKYDGGAFFTYSVHSNGDSSYSFCSGASEAATGNLVAGSCPP